MIPLVGQKYICPDTKQVVTVVSVGARRARVRYPDATEAVWSLERWLVTPTPAS